MLSELVCFILFETIKSIPAQQQTVLSELLSLDPQRFCNVLNSSISSDFDFEPLIQTAQRKSEIDKIYYIPLMLLYHLNNQHSLAFDAALSVHYINMFEDIEKHNCREYCIQSFICSAGSTR